MKNVLMRLATRFLTSRGLRNFLRSIHAFRRKRRGLTPTIHYFHQADDPYSHLTAQILERLSARYRIALKPWLVSAPDEAAAPELDKLKHYALRDAARVARQYGLDFTLVKDLPASERIASAEHALAAALKDGRFTQMAKEIGTTFWTEDDAALAAFPAATQKEYEDAIKAGNRQRKSLGHYLSGMLYFEGEWYWGIDRLNHLEERLQDIGLDSAAPGTPAIAPYRDMKLGPVPPAKSRPVIEYWFSFRSPYSWISAPRMRKLAKHYGCELRLRFILPMVMRGLPVPAVKRMYIMRDTKREAERCHVPYGCIVDPVGPGAARALAVLHHAVPLGHGEDFAELGMRAAFADGIALASDAGILDVAKRAGLTEAETRAALADESWEEVAEENRAALFDAGLWGAPTFRVDGKPAHWGQDRFWALEEDILEALAERNA